MARMTVGEYDDTRASQTLSGVVPEPAAVDQSVPFTGTHGASAAFAATTRLVRVSTDSKCAYKFGTAPAAVVTDKEMPAGHVEYFWVTPGHKISMIVVA